MPLIDPRSDPRLVEIPHPGIPEPPPAVGLRPVPPLTLGPVPPVEPSADTGFFQKLEAILNAPRNAAWSGVPGGFEGQKSAFLSRIDDPISWSPVPGYDAQGQVNTQPPIGHLAWKGLKGIGGDRLAYDILGDPMTFLLNRGTIGAVGEGIGGAIKAIPGTGTKTAATADQVVRALHLGDTYLNDAVELPIKGAIKGVGFAAKGLTHIPGTGFGMKVLDANGVPRAATSLHDWATSQSPQTALKMISSQLQNVNEQLRNQGHNLEMGVGDWVGRAGRAVWPGNAADAASALNVLRNTLNQDIVNAAKTNPHTAQVGHTIVHQIDQFRDILNGRYRALQADLRTRGVTPAAAAQELDVFQRESWQQLTDMTSGARDVFTDLARDLHGPQLPGMLAPERIAASSRKLQQRMEQLKFLHHDLPGFMADLPKQFQGPTGSWYDSLLNRSMTDYATRFKELGEHLGDFEGALKSVWDQVNPGQAFPGLAARTSEERLAQVNGVLGQMNMASVKGAGELFTRLESKLPVTEANKLKGHLKHWGEDFLSGDLFDTVTGKVTREHAARLGITEAGPIRQATGDALNFFKTQALDTPAYLLNNLMGGLFMGALRGVSPGQVMRGLSENVGTAWRGGQVEISPLTKLNELLGTVTPHEVTSSSGASFLNSNDDVRALLGNAPNIMERIGTPTLATLGALQGAYSGATDTPVDRPDDRAVNMAQGALTGGAAWGSLPITTKFLLTRLGGGLEAVMRQAAHMKGLTSGVEARGRDLVAIAANALPPTAGPAGTQLMQDLAQKNGFLSPSALEDMLVGAGTDPDVARQAGKQWQESLFAATQEGTQLSHAIHFNYEDLNNVQQVVKNFSPFATWGMKAYPFFAQELAKHPMVTLPLLRMSMDQQREQERLGLPGRFDGSQHVPALDEFWSGITGKKQQVFVNPLRGLLPFSDLASLENIREDATPVEKGMGVMSALGFGMRPDLEAALGMTPLVSGSAPAKSFWRHASPIQGLTSQLGVVNGRGVDLNAPLVDAQAALRTAFRGLEPTNVQEAGVLKKLDELALREKGKTLGSGHIDVLPYLEARYSKSGPVWDRAQADASRESAGRSLYGMLTQIGAPKALLGQEEAKIRAASAERVLGPEVNRELKSELRAGNREKMRPDLVEPLQRAALELRARDGKTDLPQEVQQILLIPTVANLETLRGWISEEEQTRNPMTLGYSGGGSPEEVRLTSALSAYYSLPFLLHQDPAYKNASPEAMMREANLYDLGAQHGKTATSPVFGPTMKYMQQRRDQMLAQEPMLAAYLRWQQQQRGYGNPRSFVEEVWGNPTRRAGLLRAEEAAPAGR